jgi:hypothetical protein
VKKDTSDHRERLGRPLHHGPLVLTERAGPSEEPEAAKKALVVFVRSLARAAAIEDHRRNQDDQGSDGEYESGNLRAV